MSGESAWRNACLAARLFATDPAGLGGILLRARPGPVRDAWLEELRSALPDGSKLRRVPLHVTDERLLGGLDLTATLRAGRPVGQRGILADADGGVLLLAMAERLTAAAAARITAVLDSGEVILERDGLGQRHPCRAGMVLLDEGDGEDERAPAALADRCAFWVDLSAVTMRDAMTLPDDDPAASGPGEGGLEALANVTAALGIPSPRALLLAWRTARAAAALAGRADPAEPDVTVAAQLVLAPRATTLPPPPEPEQASEPEQQQDAPDEPDDRQQHTDTPLDDIVLDAAASAIPPGLLAALQASLISQRQTAATGRAGAAQQSMRRGRPIGTRPGEITAGARLNVIETLRAAAPWQRVRRQASPSHTARVLVRPGDFRITRFQHRGESTVIFVVDASGSAALARLAEAKGAVELLLADCYARRDRVALLAFRGAEATLLLPPTNSLVRAKRELAGLAGGGGTPLASALDQAALLADQTKRRGQTPFVVMLTDGKANIARGGKPGRAQANADALEAAKILRGTGVACLVIDTSPGPQQASADLARAMGARYLPLPYADSGTLSKAVLASR